MIKHTCHARGCDRLIPPRRFMCPAHWQMVPMVLQRAILEFYIPGQEKDKRPSPAYVQAAREAIEAVAEKERLWDK